MTTTWTAPHLTVLSVAEHLAKVYPLSIVFDDSVVATDLIVDNRKGLIRVHPSAGQVRPSGNAGWANFPQSAESCK